MDQMDLTEEQLTIFLRKLNTGDIGAAQQHLTEAVRLSPLILEEPETFIKAVIDYTQCPDVNDPITFARFALDNLPECARTLRRCRSRLLGSLFIVKAFQCYASGYMSRVRGAVLAGLCYDLSHLRNRGVTSIFFKSFFKQHFNKNRLLKKELVRIFQQFEENNLKAWLYGSFAMSLYTNKFIKSHSDIDLAFLAVEDYNKAEELLIKNLNYRIEEKEQWESKHGGVAHRTLLVSENNLRVDLGEVGRGWHDSPDTCLEIENTKVFMIGLNDLRRRYADNLEDPKITGYRETLKVIDQFLRASQ